MTAAASTHPHQTPRFDPRWLMEVITLAALYFLTARLGLLMAMPGGHVTPVWPPSGIALAAVLLRGQRVWPGIWLGSFAANILDFCGSPLSLTTDLATSATFGIGASLAALLGSQLLRRFVGERNPLERVRDVCAFMALGGVVSCLVSATIGVTTLCLAGFASWPGYGQVWLTWWLGDTAGVLIVAPLLLVWGGTLRRTSMARWVELFCGFGLLIAVTYYVFIENTIVPFAGESLPFALVPFLIWSAVRFGRRGSTMAVGLIALLAVWGTIHGFGPFNLGSRHESLLALELFLSVVSLTALCFAAVVTERRRVLDELESRVAERTASLDQANAALRESEARTRLLIQSSNIGLWDWNLVTNEVFFSPKWRSQLGYADDEVPGRYEEWESRLHPEDREPSLRAVQDFREGRREDYDVEFRMRHKDGSWRSILTRANLIRDAAGQPVRMMGCHIDITERKQAEQARHESDERFRQIAENINEVFWVWTATPGKARLLYVSPAYATIWGRSCESLYSSPQSWKEALHPQDKEWVLKEIARLDFEKISDWTYRILRPDQSIRWIRDRIFPVRDANGVVVRFAGIAEDITESKTIEKALESAEEQYRSIFNNAVDGIFRTSPDGEFLVANRAAAHIFGFASPEELIEERRDIAQQGYVDPQRREEFKRLLQEQGAVNGFEYEAYRKDGSRVWISENTHAVHSPSGDILYFEGIFEDVTDRKRAEAALHAQALRYKTLMETSTDSIYVLDEKGDLQEANAAFLGRRGYIAADVKGLSVADWDARWTREQLQTRLRKMANGGGVFETRHRCKDGSIFDVEVCATSVRIGGEQLFFCVTRDISTRKKAESALRQLAQVSAASSDYIALIGRDFRYQFVNDTYLKARGLHLEDIIGRPMKEIVGQERFEQLGRPQVEACLRGEEVESFEWTDFRSDLRCFLHVKVAPLREPDGTISGAVMSGRDITARYEAEQALQESDERFRQITENINEIFWVWTAEPGQKHCLYVSPAYATIWGRSCESLYSSPESWKKALHPNDKEWVLAEFTDPDVAKPIDLTYRIVRSDQSIRWIRDRIFPVRDARGVVIRSTGIAEDVTESKRAEETVRKANREMRILSRRRIQEQEDERRRLSRELHDQIGQSLTAAKLNVEALRSATSPALVVRLDETVAILDQLLGQVRQISLDLRPPSLDDLGLVPALRSWLDEQGRRASVAVRFSAEHIPEKLDPEIQITCFRIAQEAVTNAVRHAKATQLDIALRIARGKKLRLLARDNGVGFDAEATQAQAVDLGLIGIKERAALVGGRAQIISSPRKGTTIDVSLPLTFRPERQARHL